MGSFPEKYNNHAHGAILPLSCFILSASRHFYFVTLLILGLITDKMYMNIFTA